MDVSWWQLPGPARFVQTVLQDLRTGKNVVLAFPLHAPEGLRETLSEKVRENELWRWRTVNATNLPNGAAADLVDALHQQFAPPEQSSDLCTASTLAQRLRGEIIWVENANGQAWSAWSKFLAQYQHACQSREEFDRGLFCLPVLGNTSPSPVADTALCIRRWEGIVGRLDMTLYLDRALAARFPHPLHHQVALAVATALAGSDAQFARYLASQDLAALMDPFDVLAAFAVLRGWTTETVRTPTWQEGMCDVVDGLRMLHSAVVAAQGNRAEVNRRVWRGQVAVLYPYIEEQRIRILPQVRGYLRLPAATTYGIVTDAEDLEVGQLVYFLRGKKIPHRIWRLLNLLTQMRHSLAHLQPAPPHVVLADELLHAEP